jgi:hypothetical protein
MSIALALIVAVLSLCKVKERLVHSFSLVIGTVLGISANHT